MIFFSKGKVNFVLRIISIEVFNEIKNRSTFFNFIYKIRRILKSKVTLINK